MTTSTAQQTKSAVTLKGSAQMVAEFFNYGVHSILYQRGIYPSESFTRKQEYGLTLLVSTDEKVNDFLRDVLGPLQQWLEERKVKRLVVVLINVDTKETLERWEFKVDYEAEETATKQVNRGDENDPGNATAAAAEKSKVYKDSSNKDLKKIQQEIRDVIRQITASVTFLPLIDCLCSFDILIYTTSDLTAPDTFSESSAHIIENSEVVQLKSFSTGVHRVDAAVSYKADL